MDQQPKLYTAKEAAKKLGISRRMLNYYRNEGRIEGIELERNVTVYTEEQLAAADITPRKPGPKRTAKRGKESEEEPEYAAIPA